MRKNLLKSFLVTSVSCALLTSCVNDAYLVQPAAVPDQSFVEEFDTIGSAHARGWRFINRSSDIGPSNWQQGFSFPAYSSRGTATGYIAVDSFQTTGTGDAVASNWAVSPTVTMKNGDKIVFFTRAALVGIQGLPGDSTDRVNRLQVRLNPSNTLNCGSGRSAGDFTLNILDINAGYAEAYRPGGIAQAPNGSFPVEWTRFEATVAGLAQPTTGRFAIRYFVEGAGPDAVGLGGVVGVDRVSYISSK
ncbi:MAG: hypothetical protein EAZ47_01805 [Bacteroidetes bacterium]|nr:MAG: hypothetical protein EAY72_08315 [Bacteroidota bacterium]TAE69599.1 MAG: hypothetical protein EAY68_03535 [Bacteroidota bacterium]TAF97382.1 MAG: hypothetical protein EAZ47_01805 [Bacteroidota bacterium]